MGGVDAQRYPAIKRTETKRPVRWQTTVPQGDDKDPTRERTATALAVGGKTTALP